MLTITYDAKNGTPIADGFADNQARILYGLAESNGNHEFTTSSSVLIYAVRALVKEKVFDNEKIVFLFNGQRLSPCLHGKLEDWPEGFCDTFDKYLDRLLA